MKHDSLKADVSKRIQWVIYVFTPGMNEEHVQSKYMQMNFLRFHSESG